MVDSLDKILNKNSTVLIATFSLWTGGKRLPTNGSVEPLIDFFTPRVKKMVLIDQSVPGSDTVMSRIELYEKGKGKILSSSIWMYIFYPFLKLTNKPGTRVFFKLRDFFSVVDWCVRDRKNSYDFFIGLESINALTGILLRKLGFIKKVVYYVSDYSPHRYPSKWFNILYLWLDRFAAVHSDYIWDVSPAIQPERFRAGLDAKKSASCIHVPNALMPAQIKFSSVDNVIPNTLIYIGSLGIENGLDVVIEALPIVLKKYPNTKLYVIGGDDKNLKRLKRKVLNLNLQKKVKFYGFIVNSVEMSKMIRKYYVALAPYRAFPGSPRYWGDAGKIRAYTAAGVPVITTAVPPLGREAGRKGAAIIVKDTAEDYASAIIKIFSDRKLYLKIRRGAISFAKGNTWESTFTKAFNKMRYEIKKNKTFLSYFRSKLIEIGDFLYYHVLESELSDCQTVLDVGCGSNSPLLKIKKSFWSEGVDIHKPSISKSKNKRSHDSYKVADIKNLDKLYGQKSFDATVVLDIIEHLEYREGEKLLNSLEVIAKKKVIILTPNGFIPQDGYGNNPYQIHKSGWAVKDFLKYGFNCYGLRGLKGIRGEQGAIKYKPWIIWGLIAVITEYLTFYFPKLASQILAVKQLKER